MRKILTTIFASFTLCLFISACSNNDASDIPEDSNPAIDVITADTEDSDASPIPVETPASDENTETDEITADESSSDGATTASDTESVQSGEAEEVPNEAAEAVSGEATDINAAEDNSTKKPSAIVWLGDSLTQGSLGDDNDNLANAPYEKLRKMVNVPVEGYGMYGYNTHDIFWVYTDESQLNQKIDPDKAYIFWVGSNDWAPADSVNSDTAPVIAEIDSFIARGGLKNYIVLGTTSRWRLGDLYIPINNDLAAHYGSHYMDVIDIINKYGYSPDNTHLSQESYDAIAAAVYEKLKALGYI